MTTKELNRDIKRLWNELYSKSFEDTDEFLKYRDTDAKKEFIRLYHVCSDFEGVSRDNILRMLSMNVRYRFIALHQFGLLIDCSKL